MTAAVLLALVGAARPQPPDTGPVHHWVLDKEHIRGTVVKAVRGPDGTLLGNVRQTATRKGAGAIVLDGQTASVRISDRHSAMHLPVKDITVSVADG